MNLSHGVWTSFALLPTGQDFASFTPRLLKAGTCLRSRQVHGRANRKNQLSRVLPRLLSNGADADHEVEQCLRVGWQIGRFSPPQPAEIIGPRLPCRRAYELFHGTLETGRPDWFQWIVLPANDEFQSCMSARRSGPVCPNLGSPPVTRESRRVRAPGQRRVTGSPQNDPRTAPGLPGVRPRRGFGREGPGPGTSEEDFTPRCPRD